jgi:plastocyanin
MNRTIWGVIGIIAIIVVGGFFVLQQKDKVTPGEEQQIKSAHFVDSTPLHGDTYATQPINITVNFNFDLQEGSKISTTSEDGTEWTEDEVLIEDNKTALKNNLKNGMPDGDYIVKYTACWPDGSCHDGQFSFKIDFSQKSEYQDMTNQEEVTIDMKDIIFVQSKVIISPGTKVTWVNMDDVEHFVNTETHPEHTYFPPQNSKALKNNESFSATFVAPGQYNYHCSAHADVMVASIIVSSN